MKRNAKQAYLLIAFILLPLTAFTQDSLRLVPVKAWQLSRLIDETKAGRVCDQTLTKYINLVSVYEESQRTKDSLINEVTLSRDTWKYTSLAKDTLIQNTKAIHKLDLKNEKAKGNKKGLIGVGIGFLVGLLLL